LVLALLAIVVFILVGNVAENLKRLNLTAGFGFLARTAGFRIGETPLPYAPTDTNLWALVIGLANTLKVGAIGCLLATLIGTAVGIARLSDNPLLRAITACYVEGLRNTPLLLQLVFWYTLIANLPPPRSALSPAPGVFLTNRGLFIPTLEMHGPSSALLILICCLTALFAAIGPGRILSGKLPKPAQLAPILILGLLVLAVAYMPWSIEWPELVGFNFKGGLNLTPEFCALLLGLSMYFSAFISEIVRGGILSVPRGQWEAAKALGLSWPRSLRLIILPQALRLVVLPITSQYLNIIKSSSLAVVIGYPDLISVSSTMMNITGQAVEIVAIFMSVYLTVSLATAAFMNWYNGRVLQRS
jgi:general L-amino acid transport system permease protein